MDSRNLHRNNKQISIIKPRIWQLALGPYCLLPNLHKLQQSNIELLQAYDATIEGWLRALDLQDKETEGHTQRVTDMAMMLAQRLGLNDKELKYMRWGGLLHDSGKMAVPAKILL